MSAMVNKPLVIKVGGALLDSDDVALALLRVVAELQSQFSVILVHGGGNKVAELLSRLQFSSSKRDGLRITPPEQLPYVVAALAGTVNKTLCGWAIRTGLTPVGLSLCDGNMCEAKSLGEQFGAVGKVKPNDANLLQAILNLHQLPIINSIAADTDGQLLNVNADDAAAAIAQLLRGELLLLSDVPCVLDARQQPIAKLTSTEINTLIELGVIRDGMAVKVEAALDTATRIGSVVRIASWQAPLQLLGLLKGETVGTAILPDSIQKQS